MNKSLAQIAHDNEIQPEVLKHFLETKMNITLPMELLAPLEGNALKMAEEVAREIKLYLTRHSQLGHANEPAKGGNEIIKWAVGSAVFLLGLASAFAIAKSDSGEISAGRRGVKAKWDQ